MKLFTTILLSLSTLVLNVQGSAVSPSPLPSFVSVENVSREFNGNATSVNKRAGTEIVTCYNAGTRVDRGPSTSSIDDFCNRFKGQTLSNGQNVANRYDWGTFTILVSAEAINGCSFTIDGNCNRLLRKPVDECNTRGENGKQGGFVRDLCGQWRYDPGSNGSDY
ncbi:hypothetical protein Hypma_012092 [Hypsizygus marmoreus]|uniref:Ecp2 effector protein domain-containing protein n=1 Tax=Hypsizygus marmoreus TaxID=39966 RepID=A0A369JFN2_HYPMA|nr:hypothetical protein Hypma_012092 [Hypsizygus marmoreus]